MGTEARITGSRGPASRVALFCALLLLWGALLPADASADYRNPRLTGNSSWQPEAFRTDESLVSLLGDRPQGRLKGSNKVREDVEVDLERRVVVAQRRYGEVLVAPEFVEDLTAATLAAARVAGQQRWVKMVSDRALRPAAARDQDMLEIEIPVDFPDAVADIIGQGARLNLRGSERISFSGTSTILQGGPQYESGNPSIFPDLDMRQQLRVNLDGTIGTKIHVLVNHDSEVDTDFENKIQLRYDGDDDEVVQKIEMGNTDLSLPGAEFLSFRKSQQGLFGAKAVAKMGPFDMTVIASKQEGKTASQTFVGQARRDSVIVKDWEYVKRTYYWVAHPLDLAISVADDGAGILPITEFELFLDDKRPQNDIADGAKIGFAYVDPDAGAPTDSIGVVRGSFHRLTENRDYTIDRQTGVLTLERPVGRDEVMAMWYVRDDGTEAGSLASPDTLSLALLAPPERDLYEPIAPNLTPEARALHLSILQIREQKNVYSFGARNIDPDSFEMRILKKASQAGQENEDAQADSTGAETEYVRIFGLDYRGETTPDPDLRVEPQYVDFEDGTITFPNITPFAPDSSVFDTNQGPVALNVIISPSVVSTGRTNALGVEKEGVELGDRNPGIYTLEPDDLFNHEKYLLEIRFTTPTPSYNLNRFNILEGSETVRLNGRTLTRGVDYDIDYDFGILTFRTDEAAAADAEVSVDFEFVPLFGQAKESLVGVSGTYNFNTRTRISTSWLFFTRATPEERPRLGQEPTRILVGNMYGQWAAGAPFLSNLVNRIPLVRTEAQSDLQLQGEVAISIPNPNTKNQIYIDDMEGVEDSRELSITRGVWFPASEPAGPSAEGLDRTLVRPQPYNWYNPENVVRRQDVFIELSDVREGQEFLQVLEFRYRDEVPADSIGWMGIQRNLSTIGEDYSEKKFLEVWVNDFGISQGRMIVDMGEISEDFYVTSNPLNPEKGRGFLDTEDFDPYDGALTVSREDFGLDNVKGEDELDVEGDDGDDDFFFRRTQIPDYSRINNFEGNSLLDTEDLDGDALLDTDNAYLSYVFDLSNVAAGEGHVAQSNYDAAFRPDNHWRLYRIRLDQGESVGGVPRLKAVKYLRLWFDGIGGGAGPKVQVASVKIVGASWLEERLSANDTVEPIPEGTPTDAEFAISTLSNKEDVDYFAPFDPGEDNNNERKREQTLAMQYAEMPSAAAGSGGGAIPPGLPGGGGIQGSAYKEIFDTGQGRSQDFTQYESLSFYLRDGVYQEDGRFRDVYSIDEDESPGDVPAPDYANGSGGTFFFRFGPDTTNFYEFSTTRLPGNSMDPGWREIFIDLDRVAELKLDPPESKRTVEGVEVDYRHAVIDGDTLSVYGAPSLARVRRLTLGVKGDDPTQMAIFGEIWVNEIRLRSVRADVGYASRLSGSATVADLATFSGSARKVDSEFRRIEGDRHGSNETSWNVQGDVKLNKFFDGRGISLPVSASYSSSESTPRLAPNSDIVLQEEEDKADARTTNTTRTLSSRFAKTRQSKWGFLRYTVDAIALNVSNSHTESTTPFQVSSRDATTGQASYTFNMGREKSLPLVRGLRMSVSPTVKLSANGALNTTEASDIKVDELGDRREEPRDTIRTRSLRGVLSAQWDPLKSNTFDSSFSFNKTQDLDRHQDVALWESLKKGGRELDRNHTSRLSYRPTYLRWLRPVLSYDTSYKEDQGPSVQEADLRDSLRVFRVENSSTREITTSFSLQSIFKKRKQEPERPGRARARPRGGRATPPGARAPVASPDSSEAAEGSDDQPEQVEEEETPAGPKLPSFGEIYDGFVSFTNMFGDVRYTYTDRRSSRFSRVRDRPSLGYQFGLAGFDLDSIVPRSGTNLIEDNSSNSYSTRLDTSVQPNSNVFLSVGYQRNLARRVNGGSRDKTEGTTFPDLSLNVDGLSGLALFKRWTKTASVSSSYRKERNRQGRLPPITEPQAPDEPWYDSESVRTEFAPFLSWTATWKSDVNTTLAYNRSRDVDESLFSGSSTVSTTSGFRGTARYSFSAPNGISLLGRRLRFRSDLTLTLDLDRSESKVVESNPTTTTTRRHNQSFSVKPRATYNFSRKVQGSLDVSYARSRDLQLDRTETIVSVALEAVIKF